MGDLCSKNMKYHGQSILSMGSLLTVRTKLHSALELMRPHPPWRSCDNFFIGTGDAQLTNFSQKLKSFLVPCITEKKLGHQYAFFISRFAKNADDTYTCKF